MRLCLLCAASLILANCDKTTVAGPASVNNKDTLVRPLEIPPPSYQPNIVLILADDLGFEIPSCNGGQSYTTPNIDHLSEEGMRFTRCFSAPLCSPSRIMLLTGKYNFRNYTAWGIMNPKEKTFANLLKEAGYATYVAGKWQLDGGDQSIHNFGFDDYCVWNPFEAEPFHPNWRRYKNPDIYVNGSYLHDSLTDGKYSEDFFTDSIFSFIHKNKAAPFFVYYSMSLPHGPFYPTPADPEYVNWKPGKSIADKKFYPSMIAYMDKKIGQVITQLQSEGIAEKTLLIFTGDNGTDLAITSTFNGQTVRGGKGKTTEDGTHVPLIAYWPGVVKAGRSNSDLIDFTDFMPTLADLAKAKIPAQYGKLDGTSFYQRLFENNGSPRKWLFCHFDSRLSSNTPVYRWVQDSALKLYDNARGFFDIVADKKEKYPLSNAGLNTKQLSTKSGFRQILDTLQ